MPRIMNNGSTESYVREGIQDFMMNWDFVVNWVFLVRYLVCSYFFFGVGRIRGVHLLSL